MIAVAGGSGTVGSELLRRLSRRGERVVALSRRPGEQESLPGVEWVEADLADRRRLSEVLDGAERLFLLTGNVEAMVRLQKNAVAAAVEAGVERVVKLSALGATDHSRSVIGLWHYNVERQLRQADLSWTILRPHHFTQNLLDPLVFDREEGRVYSASGEGSIPFIDTRDIAAVTEVALTEPGHAGEIYTLTGPEALSYRRATEILSEVLERELEYVPQSPDEAWRRRRAAGQPVWLVAAQLAIAGYQRAGGPTARTTGTVQRLTGRAPGTVRAFAEDHLGALRG